MKRNLKQFLIGAIVLFIIFYAVYILVNFKSLGKNNIKAVNGIVDLKKWVFNKDGRVNLNGQWEIYYQEFLEPSEIKNRNPKSYFIIPGKLKEQLNGETKGYMTLHLKVLVPQNKQVYGLKIDSMLTSSKIWINGIYQGGHGKIGRNIKEEKAIFLPSYSYFTAEDGIIDIVIQTSNYRSVNPIIRAIKFGTKNQIMKQGFISLAIDLFIAGNLFIMILYHFVLYILRRKKKSFLYFALLCLLIELRCLILNERILVQAYPNMPYEVLSKIAAITYYLWVPVFILFLKENFKNISLKIVNVALAFGSVFTIICLTTSGEFYDRLGILGQIILLGIVIYLLKFLISEVKNGNIDAKISLAAFLILCITGINDIMLNNGTVSTIYVYQIGMFIFVFLEAYMLALDFSNGFDCLERLSEENRKIYEKSIRDSLTQLYNHSHIEEILKTYIENYKENGTIFSVLMMDIDHFKMINDTYGHPVGDKVLIGISKSLKEITRGDGYVGRYGGEEFLIVIPNTQKTVAKNIATRINENIQSIVWKYDKLKVTVSIGVYENRKYSKEECMEITDGLLYLAKRNGRNRIEFQ
ncbi:GGDEF domain-containing protein [Clostridium aestuarii]|uniref:GGDEF domain-containing protein n=1 Tax=Clostridium aestuarii TaxID=338193 RepID=A0ABT4D2F7_9CLOT|nr:diguanylate cyclase [Clostridium aestuarii]MCY6484460.1 GGDEF domain-containing protein [Clostridium aestuarii]